MPRWHRLGTRLTLAASLLAATLGLTTPLLPPAPANAAPALQGFGASTRGGSGQPLYRVTNLKDSGPGSLRDAVAKGYRYIVFDVAGEIKLNTDIWVKGAFLTIDGSTAPAPGITLKYGALLIHGHMGAHDVIVRHLRSRDAQGCDSCDDTGAGFGISNKAYNVVLDHVSVQGAQDQALGMGKGAHDITVQYSIFAESKNAKGTNLPVLLSGVSRVSLHHNLFIKGYERLPQVKWSDSGAQAADTTVDLRNNLMWDWNSMASTVWKGTRANVVGNYYHDPDAGENGKKRALYLCHARARSPQCDGKDPKLYARGYVAGNVSGHGASLSSYLNSLGTESGPFSAPAVSTSDACTAAKAVLGGAGAQPWDSIDQQYRSKVSLVGCASTTPPPSPTPTPTVTAQDMEAEDYTQKSSNVWGGDGEGTGEAIGMSHGAWVKYPAVKFDGLKTLALRVASGNGGGTVTLRLGSPTGTALGTLSLGNTGGWDDWTTKTATFKTTTGTQPLYLTFANSATGSGQMMLVDWLELRP
jgi:pectate lyase